jgi:hypothetical protein
MRWNIGEMPAMPSCAQGFGAVVSNYAVAEDDGDAYWEGHIVPSVIGAIDAAIDSLEGPQRRAIWWRYGLTRIEPENAPEQFSQAIVIVRGLVLKRVAIAT